MAETVDKIAELQQRLDNLVRTQINFQKEITNISNELNRLRQFENRQAASLKQPVKEFISPPRSVPPAENRVFEKQPPNATQAKSTYTSSDSSAKTPFEKSASDPQAIEKSEIEKFIGENLISKIGIVILVIGVAIGAKYAIDKNWITPLMRIVLGYIFGFGLMGFAVKLKPKYLNFSAVLLSGAMAILYFITFFAYSLYELFNQSTAFVLMAFFTVSTVVAAINYNRQIIAHLGLVGAYAVPFLLSDNSGKYVFFFTYIAIINSGILAISLKKYWKSLFYTSFVFTWAIFFGWYLNSFREEAHFTLAFTFLTVFYLIFYLTFIGNKVISDENISLENIALVLSNSFIFYGIGFSLLDNSADFKDYRGLFTVANAAIHMAFAFTISRLKLFPNDLVYLLTALVITFATIAVPVQLDGNYVTLIWTAEAAILFRIGCRRQIALFQYFSFPLMAFAGISLLDDWLKLMQMRGGENFVASYSPMFNGNFFTSLMFAAAFFFIYQTNKDERFETVFEKEAREPFGYLIAGIGLFVLYNTFRTEIADYFFFLNQKTAISVTDSIGGIVDRISNRDFENFSAIWQINYTMLFLAALSFLNIKRFRNFVLAAANLLLSYFVLFVFLVAGLYILSELRESYLRIEEPQYFVRSAFNIIIRYISYAFCALTIFSVYLYFRQNFLREKIEKSLLNFAFDTLFYVSMLFIASSELLNLMDIFGGKDSYKLGLSILWGVYALLLIVVGIYSHKKHLRIGAITLFGLTLGKVFFYDIADLDTISKTIVFVSLGILMLIVSFLYNKYKALIFETNES